MQSHSAPSAKDHTRQPTHPSPYGHGPAAPHQAQALRSAEEETYHQQKYSPRIVDDQQFYDDNEDDDHHGANGIDHDRDYDEQDGVDSHDEDMDDDLMDKISSSPSIEDGKYPFSFRPTRAVTDGEATQASSSAPTRGIPRSIPLPPSSKSASHLSEDADKNHSLQKYEERDEDFRNDPDFQQIGHYLSMDHPLLDNDFDQTEDRDEEDEWTDEEEMVSSSDDETDDFLFTNDSRFIDSGWGGECLREIEDIDFEFVYALHTFVATVEGQANATKGDTMVLLDDSNSYWWLVRVVKDGSIGKQEAVSVLHMLTMLGYLPAEHIETPTERLARLNKHRNIDV